MCVCVCVCVWKLVQTNLCYVRICLSVGLSLKNLLFFTKDLSFDSLNEGIVNSTSPASFKKTFKAFICNNY